MNSNQLKDIATKVSALINVSVSSGKVVPIREVAALLRPLQAKGASAELVLTRTSVGYTPSKQTLGYGLSEQVARELSKQIGPQLATTRAWIAVEQR
jgi:hypothetical protein